MSEHICKSFRGTKFSAGYKCFNKLNKIIKVHKDAIPINSNNNVIYKINCKHCNASYVGQTRRQLQTRVKEHRANIRQNETKHSVITQHIREKNYEFDWDNVKIMDHETNYYKRLIFKSVFSKKTRKRA